MNGHASLSTLNHTAGTDPSITWNEVERINTVPKKKRKKKKRILRTINLKKGSASVSPFGLESKHEKKGEPEEKPLKYCVFITKHPVIAFGKFCLCFFYFHRSYNNLENVLVYAACI